MEFKQTLPSPEEKSKWTNTCEIFVRHHTGTQEKTIKGVLDGLYRRKDEASCLLVVDEDWNKYKIGEDSDILRHCWESSWWKFKKVRNSVNPYAIWMEVIWPLKDWWFTQAQFDSSVELARYYIQKYWIKYENVVRHKDIAPKRKVDIADTFWNKKFATWDAFKTFLFAWINTMPKASKYTEIFNQTIKETGFVPLFWSREGDEPLTEKEVKELIEIAFARYDQRLKKTK